MEQIKQHSQTNSIWSETDTGKDYIWSGSAGTSGNYFYRYQMNHASYSDSVNQVRLIIQGSSTTGNAYSETKVVNIDGQEKQIHLSSMECADGVTNDPSRYKGIGKWTTTSGQIESIKVLSNTGNNFGAGSYITVFGDSDDVVSDEKTTLTNVPANTRYEEVDTRKIYRRIVGNVTYEPSLTSSTNWLATNNSSSDKVTLDTTAGEVDFNASRDGNWNSLTYNLGSALSNTEWIVRARINITSLTAGNQAWFIMGMSKVPSSTNISTEVSGSTTDSCLGFIMYESSLKRFGLAGGNDRTAVINYMGYDTLGFTPSTNTYYYVELKRTSDANATFTMYSDSTFSTVVQTKTNTGNLAGASDLQYLGIYMMSDVATGGAFVAEVDQITIHNATTSASTPVWKERGSA